MFLKADLLERIGQYERAVEALQILVSRYSFDILVDDAWMKMASIYTKYLKQPDKAMEIYERILKEYPGSVFAAQARKNFRELRGDTKGVL